MICERVAVTRPKIMLKIGRPDRELNPSLSLAGRLLFRTFNAISAGLKPADVVDFSEVGGGMYGRGERCGAFIVR